MRESRRGFEKIAVERFLGRGGSSAKELEKLRKEYEKMRLPERKTRGAAGYDFYLLEDLLLEPGEIKKVRTGVKVKLPEDEVLLLVVRSSVGFKYNVRLVNQVGVVDADYYNNPDNEGEIFYKVQNEGEEARMFKAGESLVQGIFMRYLTVNEEFNKEGFEERRSDK